MFFFVERGRRSNGSPAERGVHIHGRHGCLSLLWLSASAWGVSFISEHFWVAPAVELRLGRFLLTILWDRHPPGPLQRKLNRLWFDHGAVTFDANYPDIGAWSSGATKGA